MNLPRPIYTICLTVLILGSMVALADDTMPKLGTILALVVGAGSAGILLGHAVNININGHGVHVQPKEDEHADVDRPGPSGSSIRPEREGGVQ